MTTSHRSPSPGQICKEESKEWDDLAREFRFSKWISVTWVAIAAFFALIGALMAWNHQSSLILLYAAPVAFLGLTSPLIFAGHRRREKALFTLMAHEAPALFRKLRDEGIS